MIGSIIESNVATGTAPFTVASNTVASNTVVTNLNASYANLANYTAVSTTATGTFYPAFINSTPTGNYVLYSNASLAFDAGTGNLAATMLAASGNISAGGNLAVTANISGGTMTATGTVTGGNLSTAGSRLNATYADVGEKYASDQDYQPGTVLMIGGNAEVTLATVEGKLSLAGIVSSEPAYILNSTLEDSVVLALVGRVPCFVVGSINKGDMLTISDIPGVATSTKEPIAIIARALESYIGTEVGMIEVKVGSA